MERDTIMQSISTLLTDLRTKRGLTRTKISEILGVDRHTWIRWETGANSPTLADLIYIYDTMEEPLLPAILDILYPSGNFADSINDVRKAAAIHFLENSTEHQVRVWDYVFKSLSPVELHAQIEEFCALDHLPLHLRYFIAEQIYVHYMLARKHNELINASQALPDIDTLTACLIRNQKQAFDDLKKL